MLVTALAHAQAEVDLELAKSHFRTGQIYYEAGRFPDAAREFEEAHRLSKKSELLYNMGKAYDGAGDHARALGAYRRFLAVVPGTRDEPEVRARITALERLVGRVTVEAVEGATVDIDGARAGTTPLPGPLELNPGGHSIEVAREGYRTWRSKFVATPGAALTLRPALESLVQVQVKVVEVEKKAPPPPVYKRWWLWTIVGGVAAAGAITAGVVASQQAPVDGAFAQLPGVR